MKMIGKIILGVFLTAQLCGQSLFARPVARVLQVSGKAEVVSVDGESRPTATYGSIYADEKIRLLPNSMVVIGFRKDGRLEKVESGKATRVVTVTNAAITPRNGVSLIPVKKKQSRFVAASIEELPRIPVGGVTLLRGPPPDKSFPRIVPISDSAVLAGFPKFSWPKHEGATSYDISLYLRKDRLWNLQTNMPKASYVAEQPLKPGRRYRWKVVAEMPIGPEPVCEAEFTVAFADDTKELADLVKSREPPLLALAAARYEQIGLLAEAIAIYEQLVATSPHAAALHAALSDLYEKAGRVEDAEKARKLATELGFKFEKDQPGSESETSLRMHQDMRELTLKAVDDFNQGRAIDQATAIDILQWACSLPAEGGEEVVLKGVAQMFATLFIWDPLTLAARKQMDLPESKPADAARKLQQAVADSEQLLLDKNVPVDVAMLGRLNIAQFQFNWQMFEAAQASLDTLTDHIGSREVWEVHQARYWNLRGLLASEDSQFALAFEHHTKALRLRKTAGRPIEVAESLNNLGLLLLQLGDYESARAALQQAKAIYKQCEQLPIYSKIAKDAALANINLSKALEATREFEQSATLLREVAHQLEDSAQKEFVDCLCHNNLGLVLYQLGQFQESREQLESSQKLASELFGASHIRTLECTVNLGWLELTEGNLPAAEQRFRQALTALSSSDPKHHRITEIKGYLSRVALLSQKQEEAVELLRMALDERRQYLTKTLGSALSERDRLAFVQQLRVHNESIGWPGVLDTYLELAPELGISDDQQYRHVLNWKGVLHEPGTVLVPPAHPNRRLRETRAEWLKLRRQLRQDMSQNVAEIGRLERRAEEIERSLRRQQRASPISNSPNLEDVVATLPEHSVLLDVIEVRQYLPRERDQKVRDNRVYIGFLVDSAGRVSRVDLGDAAAIDAAVESFGESVFARGSFRRQARRLDSLLARPLREKVAGVQLMIVSADGWLHRVPWGALPGNEKDFWVEELAFAVTPSARSLTSRQDYQRSTTPNWLVVGGVDFGSAEIAEAGQAGVRPAIWEQLPNTFAEAQRINQLLSQRFSTTGQGKLLSGVEATKDQIVSMLPGRRFVHFGTHGAFVDRQSDAFDIQGLSALFDSFLVFAGANEVEHVYDAYLTAEEIGGLDLRGTDVVTLSACETGLGHVSAGQGLIGLVGALDRAGAGAIVSALWKVDDTATAKLMETFYTCLLRHDHLDPAIAMREAQLELLTQASGKYEHPFYWAPWVVSTNQFH